MSTSDHHDVIVVGARAAGAATALLLARAGMDVLVVERSAHGDDTRSTHALMRAGVLQLHRWGVLPEVIAAGTPPVRRTTFVVGGDRAVVGVEPAHGTDALYAPRRTVLDPILARAAMTAGAQIRYRTTVTDLLTDGHGRVTGITGSDERGRQVLATADLTIGADGAASPMARRVGAPVRDQGSASTAITYGYWTGMATDGYELLFRPGVAAGVIPTNDDQACIYVATTPERFRRDLVVDPARGYRALLESHAPELSERLAAAVPPTGLVRFPGRPGHVRRPWGPGWALVGDAGSWKDPITAHGLTDALRDAELLARSVIDGAGHGDLTAALARYESTRDRLSDELRTVTEAIASFRWDAAEVGALLLTLSASMVDEVDAIAALDGQVAVTARRGPSTGAGRFRRRPSDRSTLPAGAS